MAAGNVGELISKILNPAISSHEQEQLSSLLMNLAAEEENAIKIMKTGGTDALINLINQGSAGGSTISKKSIMAASRALGRIAAVTDDVDSLLTGGAVSALIQTIQLNTGDPTIVAAVVPTLLKLSDSPENCEAIAKAGGVREVLAALSGHPENEEMCQ